MKIEDTEECRDELAVRILQGLITNFPNGGPDIQITSLCRQYIKNAYTIADQICIYKRLGYSYK